MISEKKLLSVCLQSYLSGERIISVFEEYKTSLEQEGIPFEFIIMDDASIDDTFSIAESLEKKENKCITQ